MTIKLQTTKTQEKTHPRKLYKYKLFSWQRLFSNFVDLIKILPGGIYFKLIWCFFLFFFCSPVTFVLQTEEISYFLCNMRKFRTSSAISHWRCSGKFQSLYNKVAGPETCLFIKKKLQHWHFPMKFTKLLRTPILKNICKRMLLVLLLYSNQIQQI